MDFLGANLLSVLADRGLWKKLPWKYRGEAFARMSHQKFSNEYVVARLGFDTAENEPCEACPLSVYGSLLSYRYLSRSAEDKRTLESVLKMNALRESRHALRATQQTRVALVVCFR